ncbi:hypothetical protein LLEC1_05663 [Akanthomyces lecanii]|uniref:Aminoglycoside phosphotransferase domain-containing protein n=1 Tax=Cordyceps confragosa TaxID=2714763 RepID=A0A179IU16_CORDF|nr:hypothetical protein LLEC1_05663 [Akanthomyces lecanii]
MSPNMQDLIADLTIMQIKNFFERTSGITQAQCNHYASTAVGQPVRASAVQGATSYTVEGVNSAKGGVVQFRSAEAALDVDKIQAAQIAYGPRFVSCPREAGCSAGLHAYVMDNVGGVSVYLAREELRANENRLLSCTVEDFAHFFAAPWHNHELPSSASATDRAELYARYRDDLEQLHSGLPGRFSSTLESLLETLPSLFQPDWPMVPNHTDLLENNIHVDSATGHITGIVDWADADISPFGASLEGLESLLGQRTLSGWRWVAGSAVLRQRFWAAFVADVGPDMSMVNVEAARLVGIFMKFGFVWVEELRRPVGEGSSELAFLEALALKVDV